MSLIDYKHDSTEYEQHRDTSSDGRVRSVIRMDSKLGVPLWCIKDLSQLLRVLRDCVVGLAEIVEQGKVHRDITEANILFIPSDASLGGESDDTNFKNARAGDNIGSANRYDQNSSSCSNTTTDTETKELLFHPEEEVIVAETCEQYIKQRYEGTKRIGWLYPSEHLAKENLADNEARGMAWTSDDYDLWQFKWDFILSPQMSAAAVSVLDNGWRKTAYVVLEYAMLLREKIHNKD
ncbi:hypothetical protein FRC07_014684, partial [Ceratobasidium sp. 392]